MSQRMTEQGDHAVVSREQKTVPCSCGCGQEIRPKRRNASGNHYVDTKHTGAHRSRVYVEESCGVHLELAQTYLDYASQVYKSVGNMRSALCTFLLYLNEQGITDIALVSPRTVTDFHTWSDCVDYQGSRKDISVLSTFFKWLIVNGHRKGPSPIVTKWHGQRRPQYLPRPYSDDEMAQIWDYANIRGNPMIRAALAIGETSGIRIGEICNLRCGDVNLKAQELFIRLPNKGNEERLACFTESAAYHIGEWLSQRDASCGHDHLFYNTLQQPMSTQTLHAMFTRIFCRVSNGRELHSEGLEAWSTHRLRHTMASNLRQGGASIPTIMAAGGWKSPSVMMGYSKGSEERAHRDYNDAMRLADELEANRGERRVVSDEELLAEASQT